MHSTTDELCICLLTDQLILTRLPAQGHTPVSAAPARAQQRRAAQPLGLRGHSTAHPSRCSVRQLVPAAQPGGMEAQLRAPQRKCSIEQHARTHARKHALTQCGTANRQCGTAYSTFLLYHAPGSRTGTCHARYLPILVACIATTALAPCHHNSACSSPSPAAPAAGLNSALCR